MVGIGGITMQIQSLKLNVRPLFVCIVIERILPLCAQYLRNISRDRLPQSRVVRKVTRSPANAGSRSLISAFYVPPFQHCRGLSARWEFATPIRG